METEEIIDLVCKGFCRYYKGEKDEGLSCEGFKFASRLLMKDGSANSYSSQFIAHCSSLIAHRSSDHRDGLLKAILCERCEFLTDGCDFRGCRGGVTPPLPCGGYLFIDHLLDQGIIREEDMANV